MLSNSFVNVLQFIASPLSFATAVAASASLTATPVRLFAAQRRLVHTRRPLIKVDLTERYVEPTEESDRKGRTPRKGLKSDAEQKSGDGEKEESAGV